MEAIAFLCTSKVNETWLLQRVEQHRKLALPMLTVFRVNENRNSKRYTEKKKKKSIYTLIRWGEDNLKTKKKKTIVSLSNRKKNSLLRPRFSNKTTLFLVICTRFTSSFARVF